MDIGQALIVLATVSSEDRNRIEVLVWILAGVALAIYIVNNAGRRGR